MFAKIIAISCLVAAVSCANFPRGPHAAPSQISAQAIAAPRSPAAAAAAAADAAAKAAAQQAKLHYVEIGPSLKGDYKFGYDTGSGPAGQSFREETRLDDGTVKGAYGYVDANGKQRIVKYTAGKNGFVVEGDQEAPSQGGASAAPAAPEPARRPQPVQIGQQPKAAAAAGAMFDESPAAGVERAPAVESPEDRARAEQQHAEQLRQHQLAQQAALAQQQQLAQRLQLQQQQQLAAEQARRQQQAQPQVAPQAQFGAALQQQSAHHQHQHQHQQQQQQAHQAAEPQTGNFFPGQSDPNLQQLMHNQFRQLHSGNQFVGQFQSPAQAASVAQQPQQQQPSPQFAAQVAPAFHQAAAQFAPQQQQPPQDFGQFRAARQATSAPHFHQQQAAQQQQQPSGPQAALLALHQQQQHDAQMLANLRAQHLARAQEHHTRQVPQASQQSPPHFASIVEVPQQQTSRQQQQHVAPPPSQFQRATSQPSQPQALASGPLGAQSAVAEPETFGPPVIDIRTLNYSIGQQTRV